MQKKENPEYNISERQLNIIKNSLKETNNDELKYIIKFLMNQKEICIEDFHQCFYCKNYFLEKDYHYLLNDKLTCECNFNEIKNFLSFNGKNIFSYVDLKEKLISSQYEYDHYFHECSDFNIELYKLYKLEEFITLINFKDKSEASDFVFADTDFTFEKYIKSLNDNSQSFEKNKIYIVNFDWFIHCIDFSNTNFYSGFDVNFLYNNIENNSQNFESFENSKQNDSQISQSFEKQNNSQNLLQNNFHEWQDKNKIKNLVKLISEYEKFDCFILLKDLKKNNVKIPENIMEMINNEANYDDALIIKNFLYDLRERLIMKFDPSIKFHKHIFHKKTIYNMKKNFLKCYFRNDEYFIEYICCGISLQQLNKNIIYTFLIFKKKKIPKYLTRDIIELSLIK